MKLLLLALGCVVHAQDFSNVQEMMEYNVARLEQTQFKHWHTSVKYPDLSSGKLHKHGKKYKTSPFLGRRGPLSWKTFVRLSVLGRQKSRSALKLPNPSPHPEHSLIPPRCSKNTVLMFVG